MSKVRTNKLAIIEHLKKLNTGSIKWSRVHLKEAMERLGAWGQNMPNWRTAHMAMDKRDITEITLPPIMDSRIASNKVLRRLTNIFSIRVYLTKILEQGKNRAETMYIIMGEPSQVKLADRVYTHLGNIYSQAKGNKELIPLITKSIDATSRPEAIMRSYMLDNFLPVLDTFPSYRPLNKSKHQSAHYTSKGYTQYENILYFYILKNYKFFFERAEDNPLYNLSKAWTHKPNWKPLCDYPHCKGYPSDALENQPKYMKLLWPGEH